jgi:DNA-binding FrmR family transcriptional regulator
MTEDTHNIILDFLRELRSGQKRVEDRQIEHDKRFSQIERQLAAIRGDVAVVHELIVDHGDDIRGPKMRVEHLERHAGLSDTLTDA